MSDWLGSHDYISPSMGQSFDNAEGIVDWYINKLTQHQGDDLGILALLTAISTKGTQFLDIIGKYSGDIDAKLAQTGDKNILIHDMKDNYHASQNIVIPVHGIDSLEFKAIYGGGTDDLYNGTYNQIVAKLAGIATNMTNNGVPAGATFINAYRTTIINRHNAQQQAIQLIADDIILARQLVAQLSTLINGGRGWLTFYYTGIASDYEPLVNVFFALNLLKNHATGHYQRIIPAASFRRMCIHIFKPGEMVELIIGAENCWISTALDADHPVQNGYNAIAGSHVTVNPSVFGDPTKKFIIATNESLTANTDVIFNIIKP
jgi:hypothetical protein